MKTWAWASALIMAGSLVVACGDSEESGSGGSGNAGADGGDGGTGNTGTGATGNTGNGGMGGSGNAGGAGGSGGGACGAPGSIWSSDMGCGDCMEENCCSSLEACAPGTPCDAALTCIEACGEDDDACVMACLSNNPGSQDAIVGALDCQDLLCSMDCSGICGTTLEYPNLPECNTCLSDNCCTEFLGCVADMNCVNCLTGDPAAMNCDTDTLYQGVLTCQGTACGNSCPTPICDSGFTFTDGTCALCLGTNCCQEYTDCGNNQNCSDCITGAGGTDCENDALAQAVDACYTGDCVNDCPQM